MRGSSRVPPWWSLCPQHDERVCVAVDGDFVAGVRKQRHTVEFFYPDVADVVLKQGKLERVV